jgi:hypothetical protein
MRGNRYLNAVLTIIAVELGWIVVSNVAVPVSAQRPPQPEAMRVVISGFDLRDGALPVAIVGQIPTPASRAYRPLQVDVRNQTPLQVDIRNQAPVPVDVRTLTPMPVDVRNQIRAEVVSPIDVHTISPVKIEADRPIRVEADPPLKVQIPVVSSPVPGIPK